MPTDAGLSEQAAAVFVFAAYHELSSGQAVTRIARTDGQGHQADDAGVEELASRGLIEADDTNITFTDDGLAELGRLLATIRRELMSA